MPGQDAGDLVAVFHPVTPDRWDDVEVLFGSQGAVGGCWCMHWRLLNADYVAQKGDRNHQSMREIVVSGEPPGILAYVDGKPVGWCSIGSRASFPRLDVTRVAQTIDDQRVWSVVCFFVQRAHRRSGVATRLLQAAVSFAAERGAQVVEGYPIDPRHGPVPDLFAFTGLASIFRKAGFVEVERQSASRPRMRYIIP